MLVVWTRAIPRMWTSGGVVYQLQDTKFIRRVAKHLHAGSGAPKQPQKASCSSATACMRTQESKILGRDAETNMRHSTRGTPGALPSLRTLNVNCSQPAVLCVRKSFGSYDNMILDSDRHRVLLRRACGSSARFYRGSSSFFQAYFAMTVRRT